MTPSSQLVPLIRKLVASVLAALGALVITVGVMTYLTWQSALLVRHTREVQKTGTRLLDLALDRHASIGAYLVTGDSAVLAPGRSAQAALAHEIDSLGRLTRDNPDQESRLALVSTAIREWDSTYVNRVLEARDGAERVRIGREERAGTAAFVKVRSSMESFLNAEAALYAQRVQRNTTWRAAEIVLVGIEALVVLITLAYMRRELLSHAARTLEQQTLLEEQAVELEAQAFRRARGGSAGGESGADGRRNGAGGADRRLELANHELSEAARAAESARDDALQLEERYRLLFESNPVPLWVFDEETLRFLAVNEAATVQYGYSAEEFLAMTIEQIRPPEDVPRLREALATITPELLHSRGWRHRRKDGSENADGVTLHHIEFDGTPCVHRPLHGRDGTHGCGSCARGKQYDSWRRRQ